MTRSDLAIRAGSPPRHHARAERYAEIRRETRAGGLIEMRAAANGDHEFEGYPSTFAQPYVVEDWLGEFTEEFVFGSFTRTLAENDVPLLIEHEGLPLARTSSGTLVLSEVERGLLSQATLLHTDPDVMRIAPKMARGDLSKMSIAFRVVPGGQSWNDDMDYRRITEPALYDVSIVTSPANPGTTAVLRSMDGPALMRAMAEMDPEQLLVECRGSGQDDLRDIALRDSTILETITRLWIDDPDAVTEVEPADDGTVPASPAVVAGADNGASEMSAGAPRDTASTMHIDIARRQIELMRLAPTGRVAR